MCHDILREDDENVTDKQTKVNDNIDEQNGNINTKFSALKICENDNSITVKTNGNNSDSAKEDEGNNNVINNNNNKSSIKKKNAKGKFFRNDRGGYRLFSKPT